MTMGLINRTELHARILAECKRRHRPQFTRVAGATLDAIEDKLNLKLREWMAAWIQSHPSTGKTFQDIN